MIIPTSNDHDQVIMQPVDKDPVIPENVIKDHPPRLSKNMQLSMRHLGKLENPIEVSEEWTYVDGEAVPPVGRDPSVSYTKVETEKYSNYGTVTTETVQPYGPNDPAGEECSNLVVTNGTKVTNDDTDFVEAVPVMAVDLAQEHLIKTEGRRGEVDTDPINNENFLDRPGMEIKTSETYMAQMESESESESESENDTPPVETTNTNNTEENDTPPVETSNTNSTEENDTPPVETSNTNSTEENDTSSTDTEAVPETPKKRTYTRKTATQTVAAETKA